MEGRKCMLQLPDERNAIFAMFGAMGRSEKMQNIVVSALSNFIALLPDAKKEKAKQAFFNALDDAEKFFKEHPQDIPALREYMNEEDLS